MKKLLLTALFATMAGALVFGVAASMAVSSTQLGSGDEDVTACDSDGVDTSYVINAGDSSRVDTVVVSGVDAAACLGQSLYATVYDLSGGVVFNGVMTVTTGVTSYNFNPSSLAAADVETVAVTIKGVAQVSTP